MCADAKGTAVPTVFIDNPRTRVTEWRFKKKGDATGWHTHAYDYVVVPMFDGFLDIDLPGGETFRAELKTGIPYFRELGIEHNVRSGNNFDCAFVEIEFLTAEPKGF